MTLTITIACFVYRKHDDNVHYQPAAYCTCAQRLALICYNLILLLKMFYRHTIFFVFQIFAAICLTMCPQVLRCYETLQTFCSDQSTTGMSSYTKNLEYHSLKFYISQPNISHLLVIFVFPLCITIIHEGHSSRK